jgi:subtilisin family serine protease
MSLGGGFSSTLNTAVNNLSNAGVFTAVAAGNSNANACNYSPASASAAYTTASSTSTDAKSSFSNFGSCVDGYAPGSSITSAWIGAGTTETRTINGTSMASPHVAGVAALIKHRYGNITSSSVTSYINSASTTGLITGNPTGTPNRLLHKFATTY